MRQGQKQIPWIYTVLLYGCGFLLFLEWLYAANQLIDMADYVNVFIVYALFCFVISLLQINWLLTFLLKGSGLLFIIHALFFQGPLLSTAWLQEVSQDLAMNIVKLAAMKWYEVSPLFRSGLLLVFIWLMSYLIHYWFVHTKRVFLFVVLTFIYIAVLDTFTDYAAVFAIIWTFVLAFIALGLAHFLREMEREAINLPLRRNMLNWVLPLVAAVLLFAGIGYIAPVYESQWADPVPFLANAAKNWDGKAGPSNLHKVGYGEDDSQLGGSFVQDYSTVFRATAKEDHYWRIETKDVYTGKGWKSSAAPEYKTEQDGQISLETFSRDVDTEQLEATLTFQGNTEITKLIYPYGVKHVQSGEDTELLLDEHSGGIRTQVNHRDKQLENYTITYDYPDFSIDALREAGDDDPADVHKTYTQLPSSLPSRVDELAEEITADYDNRYDKAHALEKYFGESGFTYQISDIPVPGEEQDYVDQFLFNTQKGYCDNYSTSMAVMLRTLDIPARWAKGFTSGEKIGEQDGQNVYEVTSANAHSWVEVYFPDIGWVPFEPTQGFSNLSDFHMSEQEEAKEEKEDEPPDEADTAPGGDADKQHTPGAETKAEANTSPTVPWLYVWGGLFLLIIAAVVLYLTRWHWLTAYYAARWQRRPGIKTYQDAYQHLLNILASEGLTRYPGETLREYAGRIDRYEKTERMSRLTASYERMLYNNEQQIAHKEELMKLWKDLIRSMKG